MKSLIAARVWKSVTLAAVVCLAVAFGQGPGSGPWPESRPLHERKWSGTVIDTALEKPCVLLAASQSKFPGVAFLQ